MLFINILPYNFNVFIWYLREKIWNQNYKCYLFALEYKLWEDGGLISGFILIPSILSVEWKMNELILYDTK